jgi:hypothetical protein
VFGNSCLDSVTQRPACLDYMLYASLDKAQQRGTEARIDIEREGERDIETKREGPPCALTAHRETLTYALTGHPGTGVRGDVCNQCSTVVGLPRSPFVYVCVCVCE